MSLQNIRLEVYIRKTLSKFHIQAQYLHTIENSHNFKQISHSSEYSLANIVLLQIIYEGLSQVLGLN
jgi:hypothetical protein